MKYIRTKDGIYRNASTDNEIIIICKRKKLEVNPKGIIKQADTIEELCDEFVQFLPNGTRPCIVRNKMSQATLKDFLLMNKLNQWELFGAIWTDKGLIYVAKMNDKGELELL